MQRSIDAWRESMAEIVSLGLDDEQGARETSLPGWLVRDIVAHLVHLEEILAFGPGDNGTPEADGRGVSSSFTQAGVDALANVPIDELIRCLDRAVKERAAQLNPPPEDPSAPADRLLAGVQWNWETLLRNRAIDAWMHEQDIRRALNPAGGRGGLGMHVTVRSFIAALPYIVGKQAAIGPGHAVRFDITGPVAANVTIEVGSDGRASETDREPLTTISMDAETFARLAGGREPLEAFTVRVEGDEQVAASILANLAITP